MSSGINITDQKRPFEQPKYTSLDDLNLKQSRAEIRKKFRQEIEQLVKMSVAEMQNQDPYSENSSNGSQIGVATSIALVSSLSQVCEQIADLVELVENSLPSPLVSAQPFQDLEVHYNDDMQAYNGQAVKFRYQLRDNNKLGSTMISPDDLINTMIRVLDKKGQVVFDTKTMGKLGSNHYSWHGLDNHGQAVAKDQYQIEASVDSRQSSSQLTRVSASAGASGVVTEVAVKDDNKVKLLVDGKWVSPKQLTSCRAQIASSYAQPPAAAPVVHSIDQTT